MFGPDLEHLQAAGELVLKRADRSIGIAKSVDRDWNDVRCITSSSRVDRRSCRHGVRHTCPGP